MVTIRYYVYRNTFRQTWFPSLPEAIRYAQWMPSREGDVVSIRTGRTGQVVWSQLME